MIPFCSYIIYHITKDIIQANVTELVSNSTVSAISTLCYQHYVLSVLWINKRSIQPTITNSIVRGSVRTLDALFPFAKPTRHLEDIPPFANLYAERRRNIYAVHVLFTRTP